VARFYPAVDDLRSAVDDSGAGLESLAEFLVARGRLGDAARVAELAVVAAPEDPGIHCRAAGVLIAAGQLDEAEAVAQRAIALAPDQSSGFLALENARATAGDLEGAEAALAEGLRVHPVQDDLVLALVKLQLSTGHAEQAEASLHQLGPQISEGQRAQLFALQGAIYAREGRTVKAEEAYRNASRLAPAAGYAWTLVQLLEGDSQLNAAQQVLQELRASVGEEQRPAIDKRIAQERERMGAAEEKAKAQTFLRSQP
jgi:predicted Zn-dependent protease